MRASLLLHCSGKEAEMVRNEAKLQHRTVSGYVVRIVMRAVKLAAQIDRPFAAKPPYASRRARSENSFSPRTTLHVYCSAEEAQRIRSTARAKEMTISAFVLRCLHRFWLATDAAPAARSTVPSEPTL